MVHIMQEDTLDLVCQTHPGPDPEHQGSSWARFTGKAATAVGLHLGSSMGPHSGGNEGLGAASGIWVAAQYQGWAVVYGCIQVVAWVWE